VLLGASSAVHVQTPCLHETVRVIETYGATGHVYVWLQSAVRPSETPVAKQTRPPSGLVFQPPSGGSVLPASRCFLGGVVVVVALPESASAPPLEVEVVPSVPAGGGRSTPPPLHATTQATPIEANIERTTDVRDIAPPVQATEIDGWARRGIHHALRVEPMALGVGRPVLLVR
jgi:hypothetical protein